MTTFWVIWSGLVAGTCYLLGVKHGSENTAREAVYRLRNYKLTNNTAVTFWMGKFHTLRLENNALRRRIRRQGCEQAP